MGRLILDTGILVAGVRGQLDMREISVGDDIAVPAVVIAEYRTGVLRMADPGRRAQHEAFLDAVRATVPVADYTETVAEHHAELLAHVQRIGAPRGAHDLIIAATARATGRTLLTTDKRARFDSLPDVLARVVGD